MDIFRHDHKKRLDYMTISRRSFLYKLAALTKGVAVLGIPQTLHAKIAQPRIIDQLIGSVSLFAYNFTPKYWMQCAGQSLPIRQNQALFFLTWHQIWRRWHHDV